MFLQSFQKLAALAQTLSPERYYELVHEKDPYVGATAGATLGAAIGAAKGKKGERAKAALLGLGLGAVGGGTAGHQVGKFVGRYQAHKIRRTAESTGLRSTPARSSFTHHEES
jgi:outer membrane lipoprotein SlyB